MRDSLHSPFSCYMIIARNRTVFPSSAFMPSAIFKIEVQSAPWFEYKLFLPSNINQVAVRPSSTRLKIYAASAVVMYRFIVRFRFNGYNERIYATVHETGSEGLIFVGLGTFDADAFSGTSQEVAVHFRFFTKHQSASNETPLSACNLLSMRIHPIHTSSPYSTSKASADLCYGISQHYSPAGDDKPLFQQLQPYCRKTSFPLIIRNAAGR